MGFIFSTSIWTLSFILYKGGILFNLFIIITAFLCRLLLFNKNKQKKAETNIYSVTIFLGILFWVLTVGAVGCGLWTTECPGKNNIFQMLMSDWGGVWSLRADSAFQYFIVVFFSGLFASTFGQLLAKFVKYIFRK